MTERIFTAFIIRQLSLNAAETKLLTENHVYSHKMIETNKYADRKFFIRISELSANMVKGHSKKYGLKKERVRLGVTKCDRGGEVLHCVMSRLWIF